MFAQRIRIQLYFLIIAGSTISMASKSLAQIVNVAQVANREVEEGFSMTADISWERRFGNVDLSNLGGNVKGFFRHQDHLLILMLEREYGIQNEASYTDRSFQHLRYRYQIMPSMTWELFLQHDRNQFRRLASRSLIGSGPRFRVLHGESQQLFLGVAPMYEVEEFEEVSTLSEEPLIEAKREQLRVSVSLSYSLQLAPNLIFSNTGYWQPIARDPDKSRLLNDAALTIQVTEMLGFRLTATVTHDANPPAGVRKTDQSYKNAIVVKF